MASIDENKRELFELIRAGEVILFAGSGLSIYAGYASADTLIEKIKSLVSPTQREHLNQSVLQEVAEEFLILKGREQGRSELIQLIKDEFNRSPKNTHLHDQISDIPQIHTIITTNYDRLFEIAYGDRTQVIIDRQDLTSFDKRKVHLYKIHGSLEKPESIVITRSDYLDHINQDLRGDVFWNEIRSLCAKYAVVFIGYSLSDLNIENLFKELKIQLEGHQKPMFLVSPHWPPHRVKDLEETQRIQYIDLGAEDFVPELKYYLDECLLTDLRNRFIDPEQFQEIIKKRGFKSKISTDSDGKTHTEIWPDPTSQRKGIPIFFQFKHKDKSVEEEFRAQKEGRRTESLKISSDDGLENFHLNIKDIGVFPYEKGDHVKFLITPQSSISGNAIISHKEDQEYFDTATYSTFYNEQKTTHRIENSRVRIICELEKPDQTNNLSLEIFNNPNLLKALQTYRFFDDWIHGDTIVISTEDTSQKIIEIYPPGDEDSCSELANITATYTLFQALKKIFDSLKCPYPSISDISEKDVLIANELLIYSEEKQLPSPKEVQFKLKEDGSEDDTFQAFLNDGVPLLFMFSHKNGNICGVNIDCNCGLIIEEARVVNKEDVQVLFDAGKREFTVVVESQSNNIRTRLLNT
jgi:hypothetical protein